MKNAKTAKQIATNESLIMAGGVMTFLGFYAIAELQVLGGLLLVFSGYGTFLGTSDAVRRAFTSFVLKLRKS